MNSVGIVLHRKRSHIAVIDGEGEQLLSRRIVNDPQTFLALLEGVGECRVALEATYGWEWLADVLQDAGYELHLAHPMRTKAIASARVKTDAVDARTLAHLLRADLLPEAYIAPRAGVAGRELPGPAWRAWARSARTAARPGVPAAIGRRIRRRPGWEPDRQRARVRGRSKSQSLLPRARGRGPRLLTSSPRPSRTSRFPRDPHVWSSSRGRSSSRPRPGT
jgi:Transposase